MASRRFGEQGRIVARVGQPGDRLHRGHDHAGESHGKPDQLDPRPLDQK
jgi:hypothetical protein